MAIPPWTIDLLRRGLGDVARKAREPETIEKLKHQANEILQDLPQTAARGLDAVMRSAQSSKKSVERWTRKHMTLAPTMINAAGVLHGPQGTGVPLDASVVEMGIELLAGGIVGGEELTTKLNRRIDRCLPGGGDYSAAVTYRFEAALAAIALLARTSGDANRSDSPRSIVLHRGYAVSLPGGRPLPSVLADALPTSKIVEVGGSNRVDVADFSGLSRFVTVLADGGDRAAKLFDFSRLGGGKVDAVQIVVLPIATIKRDTLGQSDWAKSIPSAEALLADGADLVVIAGDGLAGGPACGVLIGRRDLIDQIRSQSAWNGLAATDAVTAMMMVAMEASESMTPIKQLLMTSQENLRGRAERLATRLSSNERIADCVVTSDPAKLTADGRWRLPSQQIRVRHKDHSAQQWADELRDNVPAVTTHVDADAVVFDLRWVSAADDRVLAEAIGGCDETRKDEVSNVDRAKHDASHDVKHDVL
ncbi:hypothetical protein [Rubripirellula reticaptiva]|nr:hypothetical protein [Rubripirellula reticaptiva]